MIDLIKLCCGKPRSMHKGPVCPDGKFMCCICFDRFDLDQSYEKEDVCLECGQREARVLDWLSTHPGSTAEDYYGEVLEMQARTSRQVHKSVP